MFIEVRRDDLRATRVVESTPTLEDGGVLLRVDRFALTANNVTYAAFGSAMRYWDFFPASEDGWGRVPVWGFAEVEQSGVTGLTEGQRVYGYFPMASHLLVTPDRITANGFVDATPHRAELPPVYNQYQLDPPSDRDNETAILRPLFTTSFLIDDWLADDGFFGASQVLLASSSSKTALGLAFLLSQREETTVIGLTSPAHVPFVENVGYYDRTVAYDDISTVAKAPTAFVDMAGGGTTLAAVHNHLADELRTSCLVGATHWEESAPTANLPGPAPTFFFAPDRIVKRRADWGGDGFSERVDTAWSSFLTSVDGWLQIVERRGTEELLHTWRDLLDGATPPDVGYVVLPA
ncbi:MAG: DUF2855 family protein [Acidimicrobiales bacterium]